MIKNMREPTPAHNNFFMEIARRRDGSLAQIDHCTIHITVKPKPTAPPMIKEKPKPLSRLSRENI